MDLWTILGNYGEAGLIAMALIYVYKSKEKADRENFEFIRSYLEKAIQVIDRSNMLNQDVRNELMLTIEERKNTQKHIEWCKQVVGKFVKINHNIEDSLKEGE